MTMEDGFQMSDFTLHAVALGVVPWRSVLMATRHRLLRSILVNQCQHSRPYVTIREYRLGMLKSFFLENRLSFAENRFFLDYRFLTSK